LISKVVTYSGYVFLGPKIIYHQVTFLKDVHILYGVNQSFHKSHIVDNLKLVKVVLLESNDIPKEDLRLIKKEMRHFNDSLSFMEFDNKVCPLSAFLKRIPALCSSVTEM